MQWWTHLIRLCAKPLTSSRDSYIALFAIFFVKVTLLNFQQQAFTCELSEINRNSFHIYRVELSWPTTLKNLWILEKIDKEKYFVTANSLEEWANSNPNPKPPLQVKSFSLTQTPILLNIYNGLKHDYI